MSDSVTDPSINRNEHIEENIQAKRTALYGWYPASLQWERVQTDGNGVLQTSGSGGGGSGGTVYQGTTPWIVGGNVTIYGSISAAGVTTVYQGGAPWFVNASVIGQIPVSATVATLVIGQMPSVSVTPPPVQTVAQGASPWVVSGTVTDVQGTNPWLVSATIGIPNVLATIIGVQNVIATVVSMPSITATIGGGSQNATVYQGSSPWFVNASIIGQLPVTASLVGIPTVNASIVGSVNLGATATVYAPPTTSGGTNTYSAQVGASIQNIKTTAGQIYGYHIYNNNATVAYVTLYNALASSLTIATSASIFDVWPIPSQGGATRNLFAKSFNSSIAIVATATRGSSGGLALPVDVSIDYF